MFKYIALAILLLVLGNPLDGVTREYSKKKTTWQARQIKGMQLFEKLMRNTRKNPSLLKSSKSTDKCVCSAWNKCPNQDCSIAQLCPYDVSIFKLTHHQKYPLRENIFTLDNLRNNSYSKNELRAMSWGHGHVFQKIANLAVFDPLQKSEYSRTEDKFTRRYNSLIKKVASKGEAIVIPEFRDIYEISSHKSFKNLFYKKAERYWVEKNLNLLEITNQDRPYQDVSELLEYKNTPTFVAATGFDEDGKRFSIIPLFKTTEKKNTYICYRNISEHTGTNISCDTEVDFYRNIKTKNASFYPFKESLGFQARALELLCHQEYGVERTISKIEIRDTSELEKVIKFLYINTNDQMTFAILSKSLNNEYGQYSDEIALMAFSRLKDISKESFRTKFGLTPFSYLMKIDARLKENQPYGFEDKKKSHPKYKYSWKNDIFFRKLLPLDLSEVNLILNNEITSYYPLIPKIEYTKRSIDMIYSLIKRESNSIKTANFLKQVKFAKEPAYLRQKLYTAYKDQLNKQIPSTSIAYVLGILTQKTPSYKISTQQQKNIIRGCKEYERSCTYISLELLKGIVITKSKVQKNFLLDLLRNIEKSYPSTKDLRDFYEKHKLNVPKDIADKIKLII